MVSKITLRTRVFKTAWFNKIAAKSRISDGALCVCINQAETGQIDDLGGGVFKKRLNDNRHRAIVVAKIGQFWVYAYLFSKQDRANISADELINFRLLVKSYSALTSTQLNTLLTSKALVEICHDHKIEI